MTLRIVLACALALVACKKDAEKPEPPKVAAPVSRFDIKVTDSGFEPDDVKVPAGKPVTLVFERKTDQTCAKQVVIKMADGSKIEKELPLNMPVEIAATFPTAGKVGYACGMNMVQGTVTVQ